MLTAEKLRELLHYDPHAGVFTWRVDRGRGVKAGDVAGGASIHGYWQFTVMGTTYGAHRLAWLYVHGEWPPTGFQIDHINGDPMDNRISNLRVATSSQNQANKPRAPRNISGIKGVSWFPRDGKWRARIQVNRKHILLGYFTDKEAAAKAYRSAAIKHYGEFAKVDRVELPPRSMEGGS